MQNFLRQGALPPYKPCQGASFLDPCEHLAHRLSFPQIKIEWRPRMWIIVRKWKRVGGPRQSHFWRQLGKWATRGNLKLVEAWNLWWKWCIQIENSLWNYVNITLRNRFSSVFKTLKPIYFRGLRPLDPGSMMESPMKIVQIDNSVQNYMCILPPILPSKMGFLGL